MTATARPAARLGLFLLWLALAGWLATRHVMWRDEVRAWVLATSDGSTTAMLARIRGEGHPALWYLLLRAGHALLPGMSALPVAGFVVGAAAAALLVWRAPFGAGALFLLLLGRFTLFEYAVMARNYGIAALLLYAIAATYPRWRGRGWPVGLLLALLCNTNVPAALLAVAFLIFWAVDVAGSRDGWRGWSWGVGLTLVGAGLCAVTVYPPFNDAAPVALGGGAGALLDRVAANGFHFGGFLPDWPLDIRHYLQIAIMPLLLLATLPYWARRPGALLAMLAAAGAMFALFAFVYDGAYRHQALLLVFGTVVAWLMRQGYGGQWPAAWQRRVAIVAGWRRTGVAAVAAILLLQLWQSAALAVMAARGVPGSYAAAVGRLLHRPDLARAIVVGDPDYMLEPLSYYAPNPLWFVRERRFGRYVLISRTSKRPVSAGEMLAAAERLRAATGRPVVMLMSEAIFRDDRPGRHDRGSYGDTIVAPGDRARFLAAGRLLASYPPAYGSDETYDVFVLPSPASRAAPEWPSRARATPPNSAGRASPQAARR